MAAGAESSPAPFAKPQNLAPGSYWVLGPLPLAGSREASLDHDYLGALGGESAARLGAGTRLDLGGATLSARQATADAELGVDLHALYGKESASKLAYAYGELRWPRDEVVEASFGSDDGAAVWLNGQRVHRLVTPGRGVDPGADRFEMPLRAGDNRVLVKVENGGGGWGFALTLLDAQGRERARRLERRRHLERLDLGPRAGGFVLEDEFPQLGFRAADAHEVFAEAPRVRWFDPELLEVERPGKPGAYVALVEAQTLDGFTHRQMLTFAKGVPPALPPGAPIPPLGEPRALGLEGLGGLEPAARAELSRHGWRALSEYLSASQGGAIARLALARLAAAPPPAGEPAWLSSGFIQNAERQLALRMKLEGRAARPLPPPAPLSPPAPELRAGGEREAGMRPGTVERLRQLSREHLASDPNGFVVLVARRGVTFMHEGFGGFERDTRFRPASLGKLVAGLLFGRAVDAGLVGFDDPLGSVLPEWGAPRTAAVTFRHCFQHLVGLPGHASHGGLFNAYLDSALLTQDSAFVASLARHRYNGDGYNLVGKALELVTGEPIWRLLYESVQEPFGEPVTQFDLGFGERFTASYVAKLGQMILQDGRYGDRRFFSPGFLPRLLPERVAERAPGVADAELEWGIGQTWMPDSPDNSRAAGPLGPNVFGHGAASGSVFRVDPDHQLVVVIGRDAFRDSGENNRFAAELMRELAGGLDSDG